MYNKKTRKIWYEKNKDKILKKNKLYREKNKEELKKKRKYDKEKINKYKKLHRLKQDNKKKKEKDMALKSGKKIIKKNEKPYKNIIYEQSIDDVLKDYKKKIIEENE